MPCRPPAGHAGQAELAAGKLTRARFSPAVVGGNGILGALGGN